MTDPDTGRMLDAVAALVRRYVVLGADQLVTVSLWTAHSHIIESRRDHPVSGRDVR